MALASGQLIYLFAKNRALHDLSSFPQALLKLLLMSTQRALEQDMDETRHNTCAIRPSRLVARVRIVDIVSNKDEESVLFGSSY